VTGDVSKYLTAKDAKVQRKAKSLTAKDSFQYPLEGYAKRAKENNSLNSKTAEDAKGTTIYYSFASSATLAVELFSSFAALASFAVRLYLASLVVS